MLYKDTLTKLQKNYLEILNKALPGLKVDPLTIEVVDHGLANGEADDTFLHCGLGISVRQIYIRPESAIGYTGKILIWLPGQFMPEHRHRDIIAVPKEMMKNLHLPFKFINMRDVVNDFNGVKGYDSDKYEFVVPTEDSVLINFKDIPAGCELIPGKAESFDVIYGDGSYFMPGEKTENPKYSVPDSQKEHVKNRHEYYMSPEKGVLLRIPPNTPHSARAGPKGMVAIEYSMPSRDEADIFTHPEIKRATEIRER